MANGAVAALSMSPVGRSFGGDYRLRFDMWINANGQFPAGGYGSSQYITAGLGTTGGHVQWTGTGSIADGYWFTTDGEGRAGDTSSPSDYNAYAGTGDAKRQLAAFILRAQIPLRAATFTPITPPPSPPARPRRPSSNPPTRNQTGALSGGCVGFAWRDVIIAKRGNIVEWSIDGVKLAAFTSASVTASNVFVGYWDPFTSVSDNAAMSFGLVDNVRVEVSTNSTPPSDIIIDNPAATVVDPANWTTGTSSTDKYGENYVFKSTKGTGTHTWNSGPPFRPAAITASTSGTPQGTNRTTDAPIAITHSGGTQTVTINQQVNGGSWVLLGTFNFSAGTAGYVRIKDNFTTGSVVIADAVKFVYVP